MAPDWGLMKENQKGVKADKRHISYALTMNAMGTERLPPLVIGTARCPTAFGSCKEPKSFSYQYAYNKKAWMTQIIFTEWLRDWDLKIRCSMPGCKILLYINNFSGHKDPGGLTSITLRFFKPNLTAHVQPMDAGIISAFKSCYRAKVIQFTLANYGEGVPAHLCYKIDIKSAMEMADNSWYEITGETVENCWKKVKWVHPRAEEEVMEVDEDGEQICPR